MDCSGSILHDKSGSLLEFNAKYIDGTDDSHPNIVSNMRFITNNIGSGTHYPDYNTNDDKNQLFNGSFDVKYYPNANTISNGTMTLGAGKFRVRLTSDVLKAQNSGITLAGRGVTYEQVNIVDPYAVFPGANSTTTLTVGGPKNSSNTDANWWQNAIVLDKSLFTNAKAGFQIRVFTTPTSDNANVYTGYPTNEDMSKTKPESDRRRDESGLFSGHYRHYRQSNEETHRQGLGLYEHRCRIHYRPGDFGYHQEQQRLHGPAYCPLCYHKKGVAG